MQGQEPDFLSREQVTLDVIGIFSVGGKDYTPLEQIGRGGLYLEVLELEHGAGLLQVGGVEYNGLAHGPHPLTPPASPGGGFALEELGKGLDRYQKPIAVPNSPQAARMDMLVSLPSPQAKYPGRFLDLEH
nr:hypothetical protein [Calidithermus chliarophilus]